MLSEEKKDSFFQGTLLKRQRNIREWAESYIVSSKESFHKGLSITQILFTLEKLH